MRFLGGVRFLGGDFFLAFHLYVNDVFFGVVVFDFSTKLYFGVDDGFFLNDNDGAFL